MFYPFVTEDTRLSGKRQQQPALHALHAAAIPAAGASPSAGLRKCSLARGNQYEKDGSCVSSLYPNSASLFYVKPILHAILNQTDTLKIIRKSHF